MSKKESKKITVSDLVGLLSKKAPFDFAEEWDNVGMLAGDGADEVSGIVVAVNLGPEALETAQKMGANVVVCHHPPIFKPISKLTRASAPFLFEAIRRGVSVIALHTNFDLSSKEMSEGLSARLGCEFTGFLAGRGGGVMPRSLRLGKFVTYVPHTALDQLREALFKVGAGRIGEYTQCSFSWDGEGTFLGGPDSNPTVGTSGQLEKVSEKRLEVVFPWKFLDQIIQSAKAAHPYEEMAYDILELAQPERAIGYGFVAKPYEKNGNLVFHKLLDDVKQTFQLKSLTVAGPGLSDPQMKIKRVAFSPGSGSSFVGAAAAKGIDVYVCGEVGYHQMLEARQKGLTLVVLGHSYSERFFIETVSKWCESITEIVKVEKVFETVHDTV